MHHIQECHNILAEIATKLKKAEGNNLKRKVVWVFSSPAAKELTAELSRHKGSIILALSASSIEVLLRHLSKAGDMEKSAEEVLAETKKTREITMRIQHDAQRQKVISFFLRHNPQQNYEMSLKLRHPRTGLWLIGLPQFQTWLSTPDSKIWLSGIPGAGKTVLAGSIVEAALSRGAKDVAVAFFFCDYKEERTPLPVNILSALAYQIAIQREEAYVMLEQYYKDLNPEIGLPRNPTIHGLQHTIRHMTSLFQQVYIVVDGIDECGDSTEDVLDTLCDVAGHVDNIFMALLSRDEHHIRERLEYEYTGLQIEAHTVDIMEFVTSEIEDRIRKRRLRIDDLQLKGDIVEGLVNDAKGM